MRKRIIGTVTVALCAVLILTIFNVNFLVQRNKDYLLGRLEQALGRKVSAEKIDVTLIPVGVRLVNFTMADDPSFSDGTLVRAKELRVNFRLLPLLIAKFRPGEVVLVAPLVTIVRNTKGEYNFTSGMSKRLEGNTGDGRTNPSTHNQNRPSILIHSINLSDGTLRYRDLTNGGELTVTQVDLKVNDFEWDEPFEIELEAAVMAVKRNLRFKSRIGPIADARDYGNVFLDGDIQADDLDLGKINRVAPQLQRFLPKELRFEGVYTIQDLKFRGKLNNLSLKGAVTGTDASVRFE
ncbi:MAG TPA: AsmA family protein [Candidatus Acidoferrales bacterium]|nr:AsmA family protein [Candidatus Acidoferrales bacterium]